MRRLISRVTFILSLAIVLFSRSPCNAGPLGTPKGEIILSISGQIKNTNDAGKANFDLDMLRAMTAVTFKTSTPWTPAPVTFKGVSLQEILDIVGATGKTLSATALNDYAVEIPVADATTGGPIVAYELDGKTMSVLDKGPLWIVYPYDSNPEYRSEVTYTRSIWQLNRLDVR